MQERKMQEAPAESPKKRQKRYQLTPDKRLSETELRNLKSALNKFRKKDRRNVLLIEMALLTGARRNEILNITRGDLILEESNGKHYPAVHIKGLKGSNDRVIPLPDRYFRQLKGYLETFADNRVFPISASMFNHIWTQYRPVKKNLHALRHTAALELYKKHRDLNLVKNFLGHRSITNTVIYAEYTFQISEMSRLLYG